MWKRAEDRDPKKQETIKNGKEIKIHRANRLQQYIVKTNIEEIKFKTHEDGICGNGWSDIWFEADIKTSGAIK